MNLLTLHNLIQLYVFIFSALAVYCTARTDRWHRWGFVFGLASEPAWFYFSWLTESWGILALTVWWSWSWGVGAWRRFKPEQPIPKHESKDIAWKASLKSAILNENWFAIIHPDCERDIRDIVARDKWRYAWQQARLRKFAYLSPREILRRWPEPVMQGEVGATEGFNFIRNLSSN